MATDPGDVFDFAWSGEVLAPQAVRWYTFFLLVLVTVGVALWRRRETRTVSG
ncbi:hypothetical protein [Salinigranum sp. GCM10025319]|uniref:hypothetical protein n=1 Tax=Salinigranum sp. GCM10025319 TaxID=3252687 RepID=UPI00360940B0